MLAEASTNTMTTAVGALMDVVSKVMTTITGNETLMVFFCAGVVGIATIFCKIYAYYLCICLSISSNSLRGHQSKQRNNEHTHKRHHSPSKTNISISFHISSLSINRF